MGPRPVESGSASRVAGRCARRRGAFVAVAQCRLSGQTDPGFRLLLRPRFTSEPPAREKEVCGRRTASRRRRMGFPTMGRKMGGRRVCRHCDRSVRQRAGDPAAARRRAESRRRRSRIHAGRKRRHETFVDLSRRLVRNSGALAATFHETGGRGQDVPDGHQLGRLPDLYRRRAR